MEPNTTKVSERNFLSITLCAAKYPEANFLVPDWGDIADIGLSYRPAKLAGRYDNPMAELYPPSQGLRIWLH